MQEEIRSTNIGKEVSSKTGVQKKKNSVTT